MLRRTGWGLRILYNFIRLPFLWLFSFGRVRFSAVEMLDSTVKIRVENGGFINLGRKCMIDEGTLIRASGGVISLGKEVYINRNCNIVSRASIIIGDNVSIGPNVCIYDHDHAFKNNKNLDYITSTVTIGEKVWIGANSVILKGVIIGDNSVIGAGTIVTKDVPEHMIINTKREIIMREIE